MRAATHLVPAVVAGALILSACGGDDDAPAAHDPLPKPTPTTPASSPAAPSPTATAVREPSPSTVGEELPAEYAARMPPEEEIDGLVREAEAAYVAHRAAYDDAARTGFTDPGLTEELVATTSGEARAALEQEVAAIAAAGQVLDAGAEILGTELYSLVVPESDEAGLGVVLEVCLAMDGVVEDAAGTVVLDLAGEPVHLLVRLVDSEGQWLLVQQHTQGSRCPKALTGP